MCTVSLDSVGWEVCLFTVFLDMFCICVLQKKLLCLVNICNFGTLKTTKTVLYFNSLCIGILSYIFLFLFY